MNNSWLEHVKKTKKLHSKLTLKEVLKIASKTYKKNKKLKNCDEELENSTILDIKGKYHRGGK